MRINPIGLGYGNLRQNKVEKNSSRVMSNPVEGSQKLAKLSLEQLQGMNNISFRGDEYMLDDIEKILAALNSQKEKNLPLKRMISEAILNMAAILSSPLIEKDENGQTFFHRASAKDLKAKRQKITPQLLKIALPIQDNEGNTCLHYTKEPEFVSTIIDILGNEAPEVLNETLAITNNSGIMYLYNYQHPETLRIYANEVQKITSETTKKNQKLDNYFADPTVNSLLESLLMRLERTHYYG